MFFILLINPWNAVYKLRPISLSALSALNCHGVSACPLGICVCDTDGRTKACTWQPHHPSTTSWAQSSSCILILCLQICHIHFKPPCRKLCLAGDPFTCQLSPLAVSQAPKVVPFGLDGRPTLLWWWCGSVTVCHSNPSVELELRNCYVLAGTLHCVGPKLTVAHVLQYCRQNCFIHAGLDGVWWEAQCFVFFFFNPLDIVLSILGQDFFKLSTSLCFSKPLTLQLLSLVCICVPAWSAPCGRRKTRWREAHHMAQKFCVM